MKKPELNITPFVDIMLVLLAILMVSISITTYEEKSITLPEGSKKTPAIKKATINIVITKDRKVLVNKQSLSFQNFLEEFNLKYGNFKKNSF